MYIYSKTAAKDNNPFERIKSYLKNRDFFSFIYVVPTRRNVRYLIRDLTELAPDKATPKLNVFTIGDLAEEIFKGKFSGWVKITSSLQYFIVKKVVSDLKPSLQYFHSKSELLPSGLIQLIINVITRLKELGYSDKDFSDDIDNQNLDEYSRMKLKDLSLIYSEYQSLLKKLNLFETGDVYLKINSLKKFEIESAFRTIFPDVNYLLITGFNEFTKPELKLIEGLSNISNLETIITLDFNENNQEIFENLFETHHHLCSIGFSYSITNEHEIKGEFHKRIKEKLFKASTGEKIQVDNIYKFSGFDARDEIETIAKIIKYKVIQNPELDLSKICVAIKGISEYSNLVREIFYKYGIPVNVTDRYYLKNSAPVISIIRLLNLLRTDFFYKDLFYVLRSPYFYYPDIDVDNLRDALDIIKVTRGKQRILNAIDHRLSYSKNISTDEFPSKDTELSKLNKAKDDFNKIIKLLSIFEHKQTPKSFVTNLQNILHQLKIYNRIFDKEITLDEDINLTTYSRDIRALNLFNSILEELIYTFEKLGLSNKEFSLDEYFDFLSSAVFGSRYNIKERWGYGVLVTSPEEIRGLSFSILFLPGLENGIFPAQYFPLILLEDKYIRNERQKLLEDRYLFYQCLNAFQDELYLSYPKQDEKKEKIPSDFLIELENICEIKEFDPTTLDNYIFSQSELFERYTVTEILEITKDRKELFSRLLKVKETLNRINFRMSNDIENEGKEYCGIITDKDLLNTIYSKFDKEFSLSELETYAQCPFKYFIKYIIQPKIEKEIEEDIQRNEFGTIIHQILYCFLNKLKKENRDFYSELNSNFDNLFLEIQNIAKDILPNYERFNPFFFLIEEIILDSQERKSILEEFLVKEKELAKDSNVSLIPTEFEIPIAREFEINNQKLKLKGKIDRIDINTEENSFKVIDYKTGELPGISDYIDKISIQLPLYLLLAKKYFESINQDLEISDAEFFKLSPKKTKNIERKSFTKEYLKENQTLKEELESILSLVSDIIQKIKKGLFNLTTIKNFEDRICKHCDYKNICRVETIKTKGIVS